MTNSSVKTIEIDLSNNNLVSLILSPMVIQSTKIESMNLSNNKFKEKSFIELIENFGKMPNLSSLNLDNTSISKPSSAVFDALSRLITLSTTIKSLSIANFGNSGRSFVLPLLQVLESFGNLVSLNISGNGLGDDGAAHLGRCLRYSSAIQDINFDNNQFTLAGFQVTRSCYPLLKLIGYLYMYFIHKFVAKHCISIYGFS